MKRRRFLIFVLCTAMVLAFGGCGKKESGKEGNSSEPAQNGQPTEAQPSNSGTQDAPGQTPSVEYDYTVRVSINPEFLLYMKGFEVVAYEAVNADAKSIEDRCAIVGRGLDGALDDIVRFSYQDGFLKDGGDVKVTVVETKRSESEVKEVLKRAEETVQNTAKSCDITVSEQVTVANDIIYAPEPEPGNDPGDPNAPGPEPNDPNDPNQPGPDPNEPGQDPNEPGQDPNEPGQDPNDPNQPVPDPNDPNQHIGERDPNEVEPGRNEPRKEEGCAVCWGTGVCERCDGTGVVECMSCHGSGKVLKLCWKCKGTAKDENGNPCAECDGTGNHGEDTCQECNGKGQAQCEQCFGSKKCPACGGTGKKPDD